MLFLFFKPFSPMFSSKLAFRPKENTCCLFFFIKRMYHTLKRNETLSVLVSHVRKIHFRIAQLSIAAFGP